LPPEKEVFRSRRDKFRKKWDIPGKRCLSFLSNQGGFEGKDRLLSGKT